MPGGEIETGAKLGGLLQGARAPWLWLTLYFLYQALVPLLDVRHLPPRLLAIAALANLALFWYLAVAMLAAFAASLESRRRAVGVLLGGLLIWGVCALVPARGMLPAARVALFGVLSLGQVLAAAGFGTLLASLIRDRNILLPATVFAAFADFLVVHAPFGTVNQAMQTEQGQRIIQSVSAHVPTLHPTIPRLTIGPADLVFLAFFLACAVRFAMNRRGTFWSLWAANTLGLIFVLGLGQPLPALAPMGLAFVAVNFRHFRLSRSELQAMGVAFAIVLAVVVALFLSVGR